jgi:toxin ParE1/3/4
VALRAISIAFCFVSEWGFEAADRHDRLAGAVFLAVATLPALHGSRKIAGVPVYPLRLGRRLVSPEQRVGRPRHLVVYRVGMDGVAEILGLAHDRMLLDRAGCGERPRPD